MSKLTSRARNALPSSTFAGPDRSYPIPDASHAANAKARATQQEHKGNLSHSEAEHIRARADAKLGHGHHPGGHRAHGYGGAK
jgi:hypothetical protein